MDYLPIFVGVTSAAVVIQAGILVGLYVAVRKSTSRMEALATEVKTKVMPTVDTAQSMLVEWRPKIDTIASNVSEATTVVRGQVERLDATVTDIVDRTRLQVIRADELLNRTMDRIEETSDAVHRTVISPVRQLSGLIQGLTAGLEFLLGGGKPRRGHDVSVPQDEMFI
jgi:outer membrane murein-binding lipoprotein Lpp